MIDITGPKVLAPALLFAVLSPGLLLALPSGAGLLTQAVVHGVVLSVVYWAIATYVLGLSLTTADLFVPALLFVTGISIDSAMATSLVAITLISVSGFVANLRNLNPQSFSVAAIFFFGSILGMALGASVKQHLPSHTLRKIFGTVIIGTALVLIALNLIS